MSDQRGDLYKTIAALDETMSGYATPSPNQRQTDHRAKSKTKCNRITVKDEPSELRRKRARQRHKEHQSANVASPRKDEDDIETLLLSDNEDHGGKREHVEYVRKPRSEVLLKPQAKRRVEYKRTPVIDLRNDEGRRGKPNRATGDYQKRHDNTLNTVAQVTDEAPRHLALNSGGNTRIAASPKKTSKINPFFNVGYRYAKVHPIDDGSQPIVRNKDQIDKITNMFCVESAEEAEARRATLRAAKSQCAETPVQKFVAVSDDEDDDDDKFRPGVWNCALEFKTPTAVGVLNSNALFHTLGRSTRAIEEAAGRTSKPIIVKQTEVTVDVTEAWRVEKDDDKDDFPVGCMSGLRNLFRRIFKRN